MSSSNDLGLTFKFWALNSRLGDMFLEVILKLQLKPYLIIVDSSWVHLTPWRTPWSSPWSPTWCPPWSPPLVVVKTKFIVWLRSKSLSFEFSELYFAWLWPSWPSPDLDLDLSLTKMLVQACYKKLVLCLYLGRHFHKMTSLVIAF